MAAQNGSGGVVVHVPESDPARHAAILRNVANLVRALHEGGGPPDAISRANPVEVVAHGPGVELCTGESGYADTVAQLQQLGVTFCACANTIAARGLEPTDLLPGVTEVPSGIAHLVVRQREGWSYLRP